MSDRSPRSRRAAVAGLLALPLVALTGCVQQRATGDSTVFSYEPWVPAVILLGGVVAAPLGWKVKGRSGRLGWGLMIIGVIAAFGFAPTMFMDKVVVANDHFEVRDGFVGMATDYKVKYADIGSIRLTSETTRGRRGRKSTKTYLNCELKSGGTVKVPMNGQLAEAAVEPLVLRLVEHNIPLVDSGGPDEE